MVYINKYSKHLIIVIVIIGFFLLSLSPLLAVTNDEIGELPALSYEEPSLNDPFNFTQQLIKVIIALAVVLIISYFFLRFLKFNFNKNSQGIIKVIDYTSLGSNKGVAVVRIGEKHHVLGVTDNNITHITKLTDGEIENSETYGDIESDTEVKFDFHKQLKQNIDRLERSMKNRRDKYKGDNNETN